MSELSEWMGVVSRWVGCWVGGWASSASKAIFRARTVFYTHSFILDVTSEFLYTRMSLT